MKYVFGAIIILLIIFAGYEAITKAKAQGDLSTANEAVAAYTVSNLNCKADIAAANKAVEEVKLEADKRAADADKAVTAAQKQADEYAKSAQSIMNSRPTNTDDCKATAALVNSYIVRKK